MKGKIAALSVALLAMSLWASSTCAATAGGFAGAGAALVPDYEGSDDYEFRLALLGRYTWESGRFVNLGGSNSAGRAPSLRANLISESMSPVWQFGPVVQFRPKRDHVHNNRVDRLKKVDSAVELGAYGGFATGPWSANLTFAADVSDAYAGYIVTLNGAYAWRVNEQLRLTFGAAGTYADSNYMDTYFSINSNDSARSGLRVFNADSGIKDVGLTLGANYRIDQSWGLLGSLSYFRLLGDAKDSPVVDFEDSKNQFGATIAVTYNF